MQFNKKLVSSIGIVIILSAWVMLPPKLEIVQPRLGIPAILQQPATFSIQLRSSVPFYFSVSEVLLKNPSGEYAVQIAESTGSLTKRLRVTLPKNIKPGGYSLLIKTDRGDVIQHPNAVHLVGKDLSRFSMVQLADLPTLGGDGKGDELLAQIVSEINIINPNVVLFTGDVAYGGSWDQYQRLLNAMANIDAPVIAVPGNHEYEGWAGYLTLLGAPYHAVDFGPYKIISINSGHGRDQLTQSQFNWFVEQLESLDEQVPIVQIHHPVLRNLNQRGYVNKKAEKLVELFDQFQVPIVLSGHWHGDMVFDRTGQERRDTWNFPGPAYVATTTAGADLRPDYSASPIHHGYRLIRFGNGKMLSYTYDYDGDGNRDATSSLPVGKLNIIDSSEKSVTVKNDLHELLESAKIKIKSTENDFDLLPSNGRIDRIIPADDGLVYEVLLDIPATTQLTVTLEKRDRNA